MSFSFKAEKKVKKAKKEKMIYSGKKKQSTVLLEPTTCVIR